MRNGLRNSLGSLCSITFLLLIALASLGYTPVAFAQAAPICDPPNTSSWTVGELTFVHDTYVCRDQASAHQICIDFAAGLGYSSAYCAGPGGQPGYSGTYSAGWLWVGLTSHLGNFNFCNTENPRFSWSQDSLSVFRWLTIGSACIAPPPELTVVQTPKGPCDIGAPNSNRGNPVNCTSGRKIQRETDYVDADFRMERSYASKLAGAELAPEGWNFPRPQLAITSLLGYEVAVFSYGTWRRAFIRTAGSTGWTSNRFDDGRLVQVSGLQVFKESTGRSYEFDSLGRLTSRVEPDGRRLNVSYSSNTYGGQTETHTHSLTGRAYQIVYDSNQHAVEFIDPAGNHTYYGWDSLNRLISVTYPDDTPLVSTDNPTRQYLYEDSSFPKSLTGIIDENGDRYATYAYDGHGRTILSEHAGGVRRATFEYLSGSTTRVREHFSATRYTESLLTFAAFSDKPLRITSVAYSNCPDCGLSTSTESYTYDSNGNLKTKVDRRGITTEYTFDSTYGVETGRTEAKGTSQARTIITTWATSPSLQLSSVADTIAGSWYYHFYRNFNGDGTVNYNQDHASSSRQTDYAYDTSKRLKTVNGPRTDVADIATIAYDAESNISQLTNPLGQITQFTHYDARGKPLRIVDPNGVVTQLTYDARGNLLSRDTNGETTSFEYDKAGQLKKITNADGAWLEYSYDAAHRLIGLTDQDGNRIEYTLDWAGNHVAEKIYDSSNVLRRSQTRVYDGLSRLKEVQGGNGQLASYSYDNNGNILNQTVDGRTTINEYDNLDRLLKVTDPNGGITQYTYNFRDEVTSVTDPRSLTTTYAVNNWEQVTQQVSPDTGTTSSITYDSADNLKTRTDAKGQVVTYSYDALNRVTQAVYTGGPTISYSYDAGTYGKGRLTGISRPGASLAWTYTPHGRVASQTQVTGARTLSTSYSYDGAGRLATQTLPSGKVVGYSWTLNRLTGITLDGNPVASNLQQEPFGGVNQWDFANGQQVSKSFDLSGRMTDHSLGTIGYDTADRITGLSHGNLSQLTGSKTYDYDALDRLTSYLGSSFGIGYGYDANGNRTQQTGTAGTTDYTISSTSNRLDSLTDGITTQSFSYDANGSLTADGSHTYGYDKTGRLSSVDGSFSYAYNGLGQRVSKTASGSGTVYAYDEAGHLVGEYDASTGTAIQETIWMGDTPIAVVKSSGTYYVHADHLNTPRQINDQAGDPVWVWDTITFGSSTPDEDPLATGTPFTYNLRHPGQVFDAESGLLQNWHRDYSPGLGRYVQSDPIGLRGGVNTYGYAFQNPLSFADPTGQAVPLLLPVAIGVGVLAVGTGACMDSDPKDLLYGPPLWNGLADFWGSNPDPDDDKDWVPVQDHHLVPYENQWAFQNHPLVKQANINLETSQSNIMRLANHQGPHGPAYNRVVKELLDKGAMRVQGRGEMAAQNELYEAMNTLRQGIKDGTIKPYRNKSVWPR